MDEIKRKRFIDAFVDLALDSQIVQDSGNVATKGIVYDKCSIVTVSLNFDVVNTTTQESFEWESLLYEAYKEFQIKAMKGVKHGKEGI